jgi:hypothetical protein
LRKVKTASKCESYLKEKRYNDSANLKPFPSKNESNNSLFLSISKFSIIQLTVKLLIKRDKGSSKLDW